MKIKTDPEYKSKFVRNAIGAVEKNIQELAEVNRKAGESVSVEN